MLASINVKETLLLFNVSGKWNGISSQVGMMNKFDDPHIDAIDQLRKWLLERFEE